MKRLVAAVLLAWAAGAVASGQSSPSPPPPDAALSPRTVSYRIEARLDPEKRLVSGVEVVRFRNDSADTLREIPFHLYPNAFANDRTLFAREALAGPDPDPAFSGAVRENGFGWMTIQSVALDSGADLSAGASVEETVLRVRLPEGLAPGASVSLRIAWETKLPRTIARMGAWGEHFDVMQWFPKPGVYRGGSWNAHPFHAETEFFADFATFEVSLTAPARFRLEATGVPGPERLNSDGTRTVVYRADDVHDFAWVADPNARIARQKFRGVEIVFFHQPDHTRLAPRILKTATEGLRLYGDWYLPYPYPRLVIVDLPMGLGGGMEYPMLFTVSMAWFLPDFYIGPESVTAHELGHQYWYGIVATNEFEEAWLDEGINTYSTGRLLEEAILRRRPGRTHQALFRFAFARALAKGLPLDLGFREFNLSGLIGFRRTPFQETTETLLGYSINPFHLNLPGLAAGYQAQRRDSAARHGTEDPLGTASWDFYPGNYRDTVYNKTTVVLATLERLIGRARMAEVLRQFALRHRFSHPREADFIRVAEEVSGADLKSFSEQLIDGTARVDFAVGPVRSESVLVPAGVLLPGRIGEIPRASKGGGSSEGTYRTEVIVRRLGDAVLPVDVRITFEDGSKVDERWDGRARWRRYTYLRRSKLRSAVVDPARVYLVDTNFNNNSFTARHQARTVWKLSVIWLFWMQNYLHFVSSLT